MPGITSTNLTITEPIAGELSYQIDISYDVSPKDEAGADFLYFYWLVYEDSAIDRVVIPYQRQAGSAVFLKIPPVHPTNQYDVGGNRRVPMPAAGSHILGPVTLSGNKPPNTGQLRFNLCAMVATETSPGVSLLEGIAFD